VAYDTLNNSFNVIVDSLTSLQAVNYLWDFGDGTTSTLATPTHIYAVDTTYNLCLRIITANNYTCWYCHIIGKDYQGHIIKKGGFTINIKNPLLNGIENNKVNNNQFSIYPNPCDDKLLVTGYGLLVNTIEITNLLGQKQNIIVERLTTNDLRLMTKDLPSGIYFIKASDVNGNVLNGKFVKE